jgi:hypothetical protein
MIHEIDQHLEAHPIHQESKFEHLLKGILPVLNFIVPMLFFKPEWQKYLKAFIAAANELTPLQVTALDAPSDPPPPPPTDPDEHHGNNG